MKQYNASAKVVSLEMLFKWYVGAKTPRQYIMHQTIGDFRENASWSLRECAFASLLNCLIWLFALGSKAIS
jgi:hypothetical protein